MILWGILCFGFAVAALAPIAYDPAEYHGRRRSPVRIGFAILAAACFVLALVEVMIR